MVYGMRWTLIVKQVPPTTSKHLEDINIYFLSYENDNISDGRKNHIY